MEYRQLGRTGVQVSALCLGCMLFGGKTPPTEACAIIDHAIGAGVNSLDTANVYNQGASEEIVGQALRRNGQRHRVVLATKVYGRMADDDPNARGLSRRHIVAECEASLRRLQTDYIDLYQIHRPDSATAIDETLRALDDLIRAGKVRYIGSSTFAAWQVVEVLWVAKELGLNRFVTEQPPYNILDRRIERELVPMAQTFGIGLIPWSPIAGGLLSGKYRRSRPIPTESRVADQLAAGQGSPLADTAYDAVDRLADMATSTGRSMVELALAWVLHQPGVTSPIVGPRTLEQLEAYLAASSVSLSEDDLRLVDEIVPPGGMLVPFYEADFGPHHHRIL